MSRGRWSQAVISGRSAEGSGVGLGVSAVSLAIQREREAPRDVELVATVQRLIDTVAVVDAGRCRVGAGGAQVSVRSARRGAAG